MDSCGERHFGHRDSHNIFCKHNSNVKRKSNINDKKKCFLIFKLKNEINSKMKSKMVYNFFIPISAITNHGNHSLPKALHRLLPYISIFTIIYVHIFSVALSTRPTTKMQHTGQ